MLEQLTRIVRLAGRFALRAVLASAVLFFAAVGVGPLTGAYRTVTVLTGSMRPQMPPGSMAILRPVAPASIKRGDVITYVAPISDHRVVTHRVVKILERGDHPVIETQGDANASPDPWTARITGAPAWRRVGVVPYAGTAIRALRSPGVHKVTVYVVPVVLVLVWLISIWSDKPVPEHLSTPAET